MELKGVKIIRSYRDLFQLIRDFSQLVVLFWHSNDVFIGAHMETIEKFKKYMFQIMNISLTLILQ